MLNTLIMVSLTFCSGWRSGILKTTALFLLRIHPSYPEDTKSLNRPAPAKLCKKGFYDGSMRWDSAASLVVAAFAEVIWVTALIDRFSRSLNPLFISQNTSTTLTEQLPFCDLGTDLGLPVLFAVVLHSLPAAWC